MAHDWSLREEILITTHKWPIILLSGLVGVLLGWILSFTCPSQHRATKELYVGINIYPGLQFTNADDYKNWQMANLDTLVKMDENVILTLDRLQASDEYWSEIGLVELRDMLHVYWRNAGKWRLVAEHKDPKRAVQAVLAWEQVVVERIHNAIEAAQNSMLFDHQLQSIVTKQTEINSQIAAQSEILSTLHDWQYTATQRPPQEIIEQAERQHLLQLLMQVNDIAGSGYSSPATWESVLQTFPPEYATASEYTSFIQLALSTLDQNIAILESQMAVLEKEKETASKNYTAATKNSLGLSASLVVDQVTNAPAELSAIRPSGVLVLIGGLLGLIFWAMIWISRVVSNHRSDKG